MDLGMDTSMDMAASMGHGLGAWASRLPLVVRLNYESTEVSPREEGTATARHGNPNCRQQGSPLPTLVPW